MKKIIILMAFFSFLILAPTSPSLAQGAGGAVKVAVVLFNSVRKIWTELRVRLWGKFKIA